MGLWIRSILKCADNTGIIKAAIHGLGRNHWGTGRVGHVVRVSVRDKTLGYNAEMMPRGVIIRAKQPKQRQDGSVIKFDENAFVVMSNNKPKGTKFKGPIPCEFQHSSRSLAKWIF
jgi:large subunit ribosomal protein L14